MPNDMTVDPRSSLDWAYGFYAGAGQAIARAGSIKELRQLLADAEKAIDEADQPPGGRQVRCPDLGNFQVTSGHRASIHYTRRAPMVREPPSSSGPGRRPFKAVARVRIPLGVRTARSYDGTGTSMIGTTSKAL